MTGAAGIYSVFPTGSQNSSLPRTERLTDPSQLEEVAREFESIFVKQMLDTMRGTLRKEDRLVDGGMAENIFEDMLYTEYSRIMAKTGGFGLAEMIVRQYSNTEPDRMTVSQAYSDQ